MECLAVLIAFSGVYCVLDYLREACIKADAVVNLASDLYGAIIRPRSIFDGTELGDGVEVLGVAL